MGSAPDALDAEARILEQLGNSWGVDRVLNDGDVLDLGDDIRLLMIHTPGHTP